MRALALVLMTAGALNAQAAGEVLGLHDLSRNGKSPVNGGLSGACYYCHAPHSGIGGLTPLWNQKLSTQVYSTYSSSTSPQIGQPQPSPGSPSVLCLSCHDGTVAPGQTQAYGSIAMRGQMKGADLFAAGLQSSHPNSLVLPLKDSPDLAASIVASGQTLDPTKAVKLINGNIECTSCHAAHVQSIDPVSQNFLVRDSSGGQMCLSCHDPNRLTNNQPNRLSQWGVGAHAVVSNAVTSAPGISLGSYRTVGQNACTSCHSVHNAPGAARLLRGPNEQDCIGCHAGGSNLTPAIPNVFAEFAKGGHPFPSANNAHDAAEPALLQQNRHATCVDCHNPHSSAQVQSFTTPPGMRMSQLNVPGISASDGVTVVNPAVNQYENCLRCHGTSIGKAANPTAGYLPRWAVSAGDPLNAIPQFSQAAISSHPVTHDRSSGLPQPSLRAYILNLDGASYGRAMGIRILCTDCHNSDDNREFGGSGPNGPHGSRYPHIFERRYEFSFAATPGQAITNLFPSPDLGVAGPYALCGKCHDLSQVVNNASFTQHGLHINDGFSCSVCHTGHGMGSISASISGERLVNFDLNVVAQNGASPIGYTRATNTCTLTCHGHAHPSKPAATKITPH